jgi:hypothetical protein
VAQAQVIEAVRQLEGQKEEGKGGGGVDAAAIHELLARTMAEGTYKKGIVLRRS